MFRFTFEFSENDLYLLFVSLISAIVFIAMGSSIPVSIVSGLFLFLYLKILHGLFAVIKKVVMSFVGKPINRPEPDQKVTKKVS